jgi:PIN domain nuclease of toxin-antitoxin system
MMVVLDASAVLAVVNGEPGAARVEDVWMDASISAANFSEVIAKLVDNGLDDADTIGVLEALPLTVHDVDVAQARRAGLLRRQTHEHGLSLGDRACLALAVSLGLPVMTADRAWMALDLGIEVIVIR